MLTFADEVVDAGHTVVLPVLFGEPGATMSVGRLASVLPRICVNREFTKLALNETAPVAGLLRSLARELHHAVGGPGVGAIGMFFTGGYALAMMVDDSVAAPVLCQPSTPFAVGRKRAADLNLSPGDLEIMRRLAGAGCAVLGVRYRSDAATGTPSAPCARSSATTSSPWSSRAGGTRR